MEKALKVFALCLGFLVATACPHGFSVDVKGPPVYNEMGSPEDRFYENLSMETTELAAPGEIPSDPQEALDKALKLIDDRGIKLVPKADGLEAWGKFTTTFPRKIFVAVNWPEMSVPEKAMLAWHEIVHVRQYEKHTPLKMGLMYIVPEGRWAMEVQAYRESFRVQRLFGVPEEQIRKNMETRALSLYESYELGAMPKEYAIETAIGVWLLDSPNDLPVEG